MTITDHLGELRVATTPTSPGTALTFLGGAQTVTGSRFLVDHRGHRVLFDCGLFQGLRELRQRNWDPFAVATSTIDAVVVSHAHLDHCGHLPRLVRMGYDGPVFATADTARLMEVVLRDSARLLEEEASFANRAGYSRHQPALALYTEDDAAAALELVRPVEYGTAVEPAPGVEVRFEPAGHILGSAITRCTFDGQGEATARLVLSGDLGRDQHPLLSPPAPCGDADWVVVESTYGDREHVDGDVVDRFADLIERTVARGGMVVVPAFAVDRTEVLLFHLHQLSEQGRLPRVPIFVDSPMALAGLRVYRAAIAGGALDVRPSLRGDDDVFDLPQSREVHDAEESKRVSARTEPGVVIAGAGMATGGRVVHHLTAFLPHPRNSVALVGFQAEGTRGRALIDGADTLKIHGQYVRVRAEVCNLTGFSVHADADEVLGWLGTAEHEPNGVFVVHGEPDAAKVLRRRIDHELDWTAVVPRLGERVVLGVGRRNRPAV